MSAQQVAKVLLLDDDTIREWRALFERDGVDGLAGFHYGGRHAFLSAPYESRSGLIVLLHRQGFEHRLPQAVSSKMDPDKQRRFIASYEKLMDGLDADEMVMFADAVHPPYGAQPVGCWVPKGMAVAVEQTTGRERVNIHGALDLETGATCMLAVDVVNATSTTALLQTIEARFSDKRVIHVMLDNARCHHASLVQAWLTRAQCRVRLHFVPAYCPHLNPIERLWGVMHKALIHNRCFETFPQFRSSLLAFLRRGGPAQWKEICDLVTDNFRVRDPAQVRILS